MPLGQGQNAQSFEAAAAYANAEEPMEGVFGSEA